MMDSRDMFGHAKSMTRKTAIFVCDEHDEMLCRGFRDK